MEEENRQKAKTNKNPLALILGVIILVLSAFGGGYLLSDNDESIDENNAEFMIDFIDVGQGDCELIRCRDTVVLIDGGEADCASKVTRFLHSKSVNKIDYYILTHPHSDHIGASASIMKNIPVGTVISTAFSDNNVPVTSTYERTLDAVFDYAGDYIEVKAGDEFKWGSLSVSILAPFEESEDYNDMSVCCLFKYKGISAILCGDASAKVENLILEEGKSVSADIMKISHHGSKSSNSQAFVEKVNPEVAVICCGRNNSYGHPHKETTDLLDSLGLKYYRTDRNGTVSVYSNGKEYIVNTEK